MKPLNQQTIFITGATDGIGKLTALQLAQQNVHLLIHGRKPNKLSQVVDEIKTTTGNQNIEGYVADLSSLGQVRQLANDVLSKHNKLDVLINNAGAGFSDKRYGKDGMELRFTVNYLAPFLLTHLLLPSLKNAVPSRIVNVASAGQAPIQFDDVMHEKDFDGVTAYRQSKLALIMFTIDLAAQLKKANITVNSFHPGTFLDTNMVRESGIKPLGKPESGADAEVFLATSPQLENVTGKYFDVKKEAKAHSQAYDEKARKKLWELSMELTGLTEKVR
jgi:NAD(P)-dependent dehydrogenase (short-subunit alcohol dehydrogenase family)